MADPVLFDSQFTVNAIDPDGKKFERGEFILSGGSQASIWMCKGRCSMMLTCYYHLTIRGHSFCLCFFLVSRIIGHSTALDMNISLDVAVDIYPISVAQNLTLQLASSLGRNTGEGEGGDNDRDAWRLEGGGGLADEFDYVMYGKVSLLKVDYNILMMELLAHQFTSLIHEIQIYKYDDSPSETVTVYASFGGLLMALTGSYRHLSSLTVGSNVFLLIR
jgi:DNA-directed RNA polymerase I, II, and III subunit RPABC3